MIVIVIGWLVSFIFIYSNSYYSFVEDMSVMGDGKCKMLPSKMRKADVGEEERGSERREDIYVFSVKAGQNQPGLCVFRKSITVQGVHFAGKKQTRTCSASNGEQLVENTTQQHTRNTNKISIQYISFGYST